MTAEKEKTKATLRLGSRLSMLLFITLSVLLIALNKVAKEGFVTGLNLSVLSVIPAIFPFFILSDFLFCYYSGSSKKIGRCFESVLGINKRGFKAYIIGLLCGFPLGTKCSSELYKNGEISKSECERLSAISSSPSLAFVVSGIGLGLRESAKEGLILYLSVAASGILVGFLFREKACKNKYSTHILEQTFSLAESIKKAAYSSISISAYIIFFSIIIGLLSQGIKSEALTAFLSAFFEVGTASVKIAECKVFASGFSLSMTAFALGFSGLSVFMQGVEYLPKEISRRKILIMKIVQGVIAFSLTFIIALVLKI